MKAKFVEQSSLLDTDNQADRRHEAILLQIFNRNPGGLTLDALIEKERMFGYSFLTVKHLRSLQRRGIIESYGDTPVHWRLRNP